jgi:hypothetical protein
MGVKLVPPLQESNAPVPLSLVRRLKQVETENASLKRRITALSE